MSEPRNDDPQRDRELEGYLAGRHALSVRYLDASRETAPPELDAAILAAARDAAAGAPRRRAGSRWRVPLAAAATMVLGVSLVSQLRDDAVPEAVRAERDMPPLRQAPAAVPFETLSAESVADAVVPSAPMPPPMAQAKAVAPTPSQNDLAGDHSEERLDAVPMQEREAAAQRERLAEAEMRAAAPQAHAFALAPAPPRTATLDEVSIAARDLLGLLRSGNTDDVAARAVAPSRAAVLGSLSHFADAHAAQVHADHGEGWQVIYRDAAGRRLGVAVLQVSDAGWQILRLEAEAPGRGVE